MNTDLRRHSRFARFAMTVALTLLVLTIDADIRAQTPTAKQPIQQPAGQAPAAQQPARQTPCLTAPEHRQFDFWVGDWQVFTPQGQLAGTNRIERVTDGCIILENWMAAGGGSGKSFNYYDRNDGKWHQLWIGSTGGVIHFVGEFKDGAMRYTTTTTTNGAKVLGRMTFFPQGDKVRQLWEQSNDEGKTWTVAFDGTYVKKS